MARTWRGAEPRGALCYGRSHMTAPAMTARPALRVRPATLADLDAVAAFLARSLGGGGPPRYRRLFEYAWLADKPNIGALIEHDGRIGGFLGALYSRRTIAGHARSICNLTSWAVDEPCRRASLAMLKCLLDQRGHIFTTFSASPQVAEILTVLKFQTARSHKLLFTAAAGLVRRPRGEPIEVVDGADRVAPRLDPDHRQILDDHRPYRCGHIYLERAGRRCYAVTVRRGRGSRAFADVLYASDPQLFVDAIGAVQAALFRAHRTLLTGIDLRWIDHPPALALCYTALRPVMFRADAPASAAAGPGSAGQAAPIAAPGGQTAAAALPSIHARDICALHSELVPMYG
jgi:hypothetical protein